MAKGAMRGAILRGRHYSRFFRLLDGSFLFRLVISAAGSLALLLLVNSYATCRNNQWAKGCLRRNAEACNLPAPNGHWHQANLPKFNTLAADR